LPGARGAQASACERKWLTIIDNAPTCREAVTALEWLVMTDPDCARLEAGIVGPADCPDGGR
jgi:hypothetical protein